MFDKFFEKYPDYHVVEKPSPQMIGLFEGSLPEEILFIWQNYGFGIFAGGYLRFIDPAQFRAFTDENIENTGSEYIPFAVSAFGDLFIWERKDNGYVEFYDFRHSTFKTLSTRSGLDLLFDVDLIDESFIANELNAPDFSAAQAKLGTPTYGQCYGYFPLLALGGPESIEHIQLVDLQVHMELMAQASGPL